MVKSLDTHFEKCENFKLILEDSDFNNFRYLYNK